MILIGRYLSPFVRRVGITLNLYDIPYEHQPLQAFGDEKAKVRERNPISRVPALVLDDGECIVDSAAIIDYLDQTVGPQRALTPAAGPQRRRMLSLLGIAAGATEKAVLTVYEVRLRPQDKRHPPWVEMCASQAKDGFEYLERQIEGPWMTGESLSQLDVTTVACWQFVETANPQLAERIACPGIARLAARAMEMDAFRRTAS